MIDSVNPEHTRYAIFLRLVEAQIVTVGKLGTNHFNSGNYIYVGSAKKNILTRVGRHVKRDKVMRWHFDYLRRFGEIVEIRSFDDSIGECELVEQLRRKYCGVFPMKKFGSSDCRCFSHLLYFGEEVKE